MKWETLTQNFEERERNLKKTHFTSYIAGLGIEPSYVAYETTEWPLLYPAQIVDSLRKILRLDVKQPTQLRNESTV